MQKFILSAVCHAGNRIVSTGGHCPLRVQAQVRRAARLSVAILVARTRRSKKPRSAPIRKGVGSAKRGFGTGE